MMSSNVNKYSETVSSKNVENALTIGFIGCGTIASAIATGLAVQETIPLISIIVSKRSISKSLALRERFPLKVEVESDNQQIVDLSDILFLTMLPEQATEILQGLKFSSKIVIISLVSTSKICFLSNDTRLPINQIFKMICLPAVAYSEGMCILQPDPSTRTADNSVNKKIQVLLPLLDTLGGVVTAADDVEMAAMMVPTALMGSFYGILQNNRDWLTRRHNLPQEKATFLVSKMYNSMMLDIMRRLATSTIADTNDTGTLFDVLISEQTPGGLNEQVLGNLQRLGVFEAYDAVQNAVVCRIQGTSDGTLTNQETCKDKD
jgi:pyrroline-5-carboxylate reductase